jgi:hypothetical protein
VGEPQILIGYDWLGRRISPVLFTLSQKITKPPQCPDWDIDMHFLASQPTKRVFASAILKRVFFLCPIASVSAIDSW